MVLGLQDDPAKLWLRQRRKNPKLFTQKKFRTKRAKPLLATNLKSACLHLTTLPKNAYSVFLKYNIIQKNICDHLWTSQHILNTSENLYGFSVINRGHPENIWRHLWNIWKHLTSSWKNVRTGGGYASHRGRLSIKVTTQLKTLENS